MSVIVKDMQMPKACMLCPIYDGEYGEYGVLHDRNLFPLLSEDTYRYDTTKEIHKDCPLVERPQGEWIIDGHHIRCNRCNEYICNTDREGNKIPDNFCPNCGADMRGKEK